MEELLLQIVTHPYGAVVALLSVLAAIGLLVFLWGSSGYILAHGDAEHQQHARVQIVRGLFFLLIVISVWEIARYIAAIIQGTNDAPVIAPYIAAFWVLNAIFLFIRKATKGSPGGGH